MLTYLLSLIAMFLTPIGLASAPVTAPAPPVAQPGFDWLGGTWRTEALEMQCRVTPSGAACREQGRGEAMQGAQADLTFTAAGGETGSQLKVALPSVPASSFTQIARDGQSVTYQMTTKVGIARLRFTRAGDVLKVERGNAEAWATTMTYQKG